MKKTHSDIPAIRELHRAGQLDEAKKAYLAILRKNPRQVDALHSLGILCAQQENFSDAIHYLESALKHQPHDPVMQLHLANVLKIQGLFSQAATVLLNLLQSNPNYTPALNNLGTVYFAQGKLTDATHYYRLAIEQQPNFADAYYNLGIALARQNETDEAISMYKKLLALQPDHFAARFHLGCTLMQQEKLDDALDIFLAIEQSLPFHFETQTNLATCYLKQGALNEARSHYLKALNLKPEDTQVLFNLGVINMQQGNIDNAIQYYQKALQINADFFAAHNNAGVAFLAKNHPEFALQHFQEALRLQPQNEAIRYTVNVLSQNQRLLAAPTDYVKSLFDAYADHYESHLLTALDYKIPALLFDALSPFLFSSMDILDLGCGTGLCGIPFKKFARSLTGVDVSEKMLEIAAQKNIYDELTTNDIITFLTDKNSTYDLIIAGDVLVYTGDAETIFTHAAHALRAGGLFAFNTEISEDGDYKMNQSGRFSHQKNYLERIAKKNHFEPIYYQVVVTRMQNNEPVYGHLFVMRQEKPS